MHIEPFKAQTHYDKWNNLKKIVSEYVLPPTLQGRGHWFLNWFVKAGLPDHIAQVNSVTLGSFHAAVRSSCWQGDPTGAPCCSQGVIVWNWITLKNFFWKYIIPSKMERVWGMCGVRSFDRARRWPSFSLHLSVFTNLATWQWAALVIMSSGLLSEEGCRWLEDVELGMQKSKSSVNF